MATALFQKIEKLSTKSGDFFLFENGGVLFEFYAEFPLGRARETRPDSFLGGWLFGAVWNALVCDHKRIQVHGQQTKWPGG